jgi:hypothetical protein
MSDFLIYAARLQDAGIEHLSVRIFTAKDRTRMMRVAPHGSYPQEVHSRWLCRDFELCGTDRVLERVKDDMLYSDDGVTAEKVQAAIDAHPLLRDDLCAFLADWTLTQMPTDEEVASYELTAAEEEAGNRMADKVKAWIHGIDIARSRDAMRRQSSDAADQDLA